MPRRPVSHWRIFDGRTSATGTIGVPTRTLEGCGDRAGNTRAENPWDQRVFPLGLAFRNFTLFTDANSVKKSIEDRRWVASIVRLFTQRKVGACPILGLDQPNEGNAR